MKKKHILSAAVGAGVVALALSACAPPEQPDLVDTGDFQALAEAAGKEGVVNVYAALDESFVTEAIAEFEETYGVVVQYVQETTNNLAPKFNAEVDAGAVNADVVITSAAEYWFFEDGIERGALLDLAAAEVPGWPGNYPTEFLTAENVPTIMIQPSGIAVNVDQVDPASITDWTDLADPKWAGKIGMTPALAGAGQLPPWVALVDHYGDEWATAVGQNAADHVYKSNRDMAAAVVAGEIAVSMPPGYQALAEYIDSGAPIEFVSFDFMGALGSAIAVSAEGPNPNAARLFVSYLLSGGGLEKMQAAAGTENMMISTDGPLVALPANLTWFERGFENEAPRIHELLGVAGQAAY